MANGYVNNSVIKGQLDEVACAASSTTAISDVINMTSEDSRNVLAYVTLDSVIEKTGITVVLQDSADNGTTWATVQTTNVATTADVKTFTFPAKAGATGGDYIIFYDTSGASWAIALDTDGAVAPSASPLWDAVAAANKVVVDLTAATDAASVAALVETAVDALTGFTGVITTSDAAADGTMTFTQVSGGEVLDAVPGNDDDSGVGSITAANTTPGVFTASYELENNVYDGTDTATWPIARLVVVTGAGDSATATGVRITRRL